MPLPRPKPCGFVPFSTVLSGTIPTGVSPITTGNMPWVESTSWAREAAESSPTPAVVGRDLQTENRSWSTGYVEAVATEPDAQGLGHGTEVMKVIGEIVRGSYQLGALGTSSFHFYERLGWERWMGPMAVRTDSGLLPTPEDEGFLMILRTPASKEIDAVQLITCEWRPGDVW